MAEMSVADYLAKLLATRDGVAEVVGMDPNTAQTVSAQEFARLIDVRMKEAYNHGYMAGRHDAFGDIAMSDKRQEAVSALHDFVNAGGSAESVVDAMLALFVPESEPEQTPAERRTGEKLLGVLRAGGEPNEEAVEMVVNALFIAHEDGRANRHVAWPVRARDLLARLAALPVATKGAAGEGASEFREDRRAGAWLHRALYRRRGILLTVDECADVLNHANVMAREYPNDCDTGKGWYVEPAIPESAPALPVAGEPVAYRWRWKRAPGADPQWGPWLYGDTVDMDDYPPGPPEPGMPERQMEALYLHPQPAGAPSDEIQRLREERDQAVANAATFAAQRDQAIREAREVQMDRILSVGAPSDGLRELRATVQQWRHEGQAAQVRIDFDRVLAEIDRLSASSGERYQGLIVSLSRIKVPEGFTDARVRLYDVSEEAWKRLKAWAPSIGQAGDRVEIRVLPTQGEKGGAG